MFAKSLLVTGALTCKYCVCQPAQTSPLLRIPAIDDGPASFGHPGTGQGTSPVFSLDKNGRLPDLRVCTLSSLTWMKSTIWMLILCDNNSCYWIPREWKARGCTFKCWYAIKKQKDLICELQLRGFQTLKRSLWSILKNSTSKSVIS